MIVTYLDLKTGKKASQSGISDFDLTENNWSCDCNRAIAFGLDDESNVCSGKNRFIVISVEMQEGDENHSGLSDVTKRANEGYPTRITEEVHPYQPETWMIDQTYSHSEVYEVNTRVEFRAVCECGCQFLNELKKDISDEPFHVEYKCPECSKLNGFWIKASD